MAAFQQREGKQRESLPSRCNLLLGRKLNRTVRDSEARRLTTEPNTVANRYERQRWRLQAIAAAPAPPPKLASDCSLSDYSEEGARARRQGRQKKREFARTRR